MSGRLQIQLPPGRYRIGAERGPEHRPVSVDLELREGERRRVSEADRAAMLDFFAKGRAVYERLAR